MEPTAHFNQSEVCHIIGNVMTKCHRDNCGLCKLMSEENHFTFAKKTFTVNATMLCDVKNVIYVIQCRGCGITAVKQRTCDKHNGS